MFRKLRGKKLKLIVKLIIYENNVNSMYIKIFMIMSDVIVNIDINNLHNNLNHDRLLVI